MGSTKRRDGAVDRSLRLTRPAFQKEGGTAGIEVGVADGPPIDKRDLPERTFEFARRIVTLCRALDRRSGIGRTLGQRLLRAGCSVGANIEEGQASQSRADFASKYAIACKEAREARYWLRLVAAAELVPARRLENLRAEATELIAILTTIVKKTRPVKEPHRRRPRIAK